MAHEQTTMLQPRVAGGFAEGVCVLWVSLVRGVWEGEARFARCSLGGIIIKQEQHHEDQQHI